MPADDDCHGHAGRNHQPAQRRPAEPWAPSTGTVPIFAPTDARRRGRKWDCPLWFSPPEDRQADRRADSGRFQEDQAAGQAADQYGARRVDCHRGEMATASRQASVNAAQIAAWG